jgi:branched-chain amino acid transport system permease protein
MSQPVIDTEPPSEPSGAEIVKQRLRRAWDHPVQGLLLRAVLGYLVLVEGLLQLLLGRVAIIDLGLSSSAIPRGVIFNGMVIGTLYALVGMGLILVYRANRIINFAQAQLGAVPAILALLLLSRQGWHYALVVPIVIIGGALLGGAVEFGFMRRFHKASRMSLTVVTIGVGFLLLVLEFVVKFSVAGDIQDTVTGFPTPFQGYEFTFGMVVFSGDHIVTILVVAALMGVLAAFFQFTDLGIAVRAAAENAARASLLGIPVKRVSTIVWCLAGVLSAIGIFLRAPLIGLPLQGFVGPAVLLFGLATAVMAGMERLPMAVLAGMFVGIVDQSVLFSTGRAALASGAVLIVILVALLVQKGATSRAYQATSNWEMVKSFRPIPSELRLLPEVRHAKRAVSAFVLLGALAGPFLLGDGGASFAIHIVVYSMIGVSLVVLTGWAGQISLGQFAIAGMGAAIAGGVVANYDADFFVALTMAGLGGAMVALLIGLPALRIQGLFLAVTTLAFAFAVQNVVLNREYFGWLLPDSMAFVERPNLYGRLDLGESSQVLGLTLSSEAKLYYVGLVLLALVLVAARSFRRNRSGRVLIGVRDNSRVMEAFGVSTVHTRLVAFALSGFIAALAGALFVFEQGSVDAGTFNPERSIQVFVMTVIGGIGSLAGAVVGAVFVLGVPLMPGLRNIPMISLVSSGIGVLLVLYFLPGGLVGGMYGLRDRYLRWVAARNGIHVPSLVADSLVDQADEDVVIAASEQLDEQVPCPVCGEGLSPTEGQAHTCSSVPSGAGENGNGRQPTRTGSSS